MIDSNLFPQVLLLAAGALTTLLGAMAYVWKRDADRKLLEVQRQADEALQQAQQVTALTQAIARLAESWMRSDERASDERRRFSENVAAYTGTQSRLAEAVESNADMLATTYSSVGTLRDDMLLLKQVVDALPDVTAARVQAALAPLAARLDAVRAELAETRALLAEASLPGIKTPC
jgi:chromosome segregation ATPase